MFSSFVASYAKEELEVLKSSLNHCKGIEKVDTLNKISEILSQIEPVEATAYADEALNLADSIGYLDGKARALANIGLIYDGRGYYKKAIENYEAALVLLEGRDLSKKVYVFSRMGNAYGMDGNFSKALLYLYKAFEICKSDNNLKTLYKIANNIGSLYIDMGNISKAAEYLSLSLEIMQKVNDEKGMAYTLFNLGTCCYNKDDFKKSIEYLLRSMEISRIFHLNNNLLNVLNSLSNNYSELKMFDKALEYQDLHLRLSDSLKLDGNVALSYLNYSRIYLKMNKSDQAKSFLDKALKKYTELQDERGVADVYSSIGEYYQLKKDFNQALKFLQKGLEYYQRENLLYDLKEMYAAISETYLKSNNPYKALDYQKLLTAVKDSIANIENRNLYAAIESKAKAETEIMEINRKHEVEKENYKFTLNLFASFIFLLIIIGLFYLLYKKREKMLLSNKEKLKDYAENNQTVVNTLTSEVKELLFSIALSISMLSDVTSKNTKVRLSTDYNKLKDKISEIATNLGSRK